MKDLIVKDNALINAGYSLTIVEQRIILLAIVEARRTNTGITANDPLTIHADSYITHFDAHKNTAYSALQEACKNLFERRFTYQEINKKGNLEKVYSRWVSEVRYIDNEASVKLIFSPAVVPLITQLEKQFTSYEIEQVSNLSSTYAIRLYELLIQWRNVGKTPIFAMGEFKRRLGVEEKEYIRMSDFKKRVLDVAIKQINEHTDITASYEQHKAGRVITGFSFTFKLKKPIKTAKNTTPVPVPPIPSDTKLETVDKPMTKVEAQQVYAGLMATASSLLQTSSPSLTKEQVQQDFQTLSDIAKAMGVTPEKLASAQQKEAFRALGFMK